MTVQTKWAEPLFDWQFWVPPIVLSVFLIVVAQYNFLTFHTLAELFAIVISFIMFAFAWSTYGFSRNDFLLFLACGYFWIGSLDLLHTLVYKGLNVIVEGNGNLSVQFWIGTRYLEAVLLLAAPFAATRKQNGYLLVSVFGGVAVALTAVIFLGVFPTGFIEGYGLTDFKIYSEYVIIFILALALIALLRYGQSISTEEKTLISASIVMTMCAEIAFTYYVSVYGASNLAGHIFKIFSYWLIFRAIVLSNLKKPFYELASIKDYNRKLFETTSIGLALCKMDGTLIDVNPAYAKILGRSVDETLGLDYWDVTPEKYAPQEQYQLDRLNSVGKYGPYVKEYLHKDGSLVPVQLSGKIIEQNGERLIWSSVEDISERQALEGQLRQAQKMEAVGQLTGGVAHDFNNLLAIMIGNTEMLSDRLGSDEEARRNVGAITKAIDRADSLTSRLLAFSRQQALSPNAANVAHLIDGIEGMLQSSLGEMIDLKIEPARDLWQALIDAHQFENALINLAINARDAMPTGGALTIRCDNVTLDAAYAAQHEDVIPGDYVRVAVTDTGTGIRPEIMQKVFEPFFTTKDVGQGSGLGLSMVYGFAKQSNGHITIHSKVNQGTTLKIYMPRSPTAAINAIVEDGVLAASQGAERILIVEDDASVRKIPASILREQGYEVVEAENGVEAIRCLTSGPAFDLLFTDVVLRGGMNGVEIAKEAVLLQPDIKVLFTTGYAQDTGGLQGELGFGAVLINKPYRRAKLLETVHAILDSKDVFALRGDVNASLH